jgi:hypothetical protein
MKNMITLELLGSRVLTLTAEVRDLQQRFTAMERRSANGGAPWGLKLVLRAWKTGRGSGRAHGRMLSLLVRIAER